MVRKFLLYSLLFGFLNIIFGFFFIKYGYNFLIKNSEIKEAKIFVVATHNIKSLNTIANNLKNRNYLNIITVGSDIDYGAMFYKHNNYAFVTKDLLIEKNFNKDKITPLKVINSEKNFAISLAKVIKKNLKDRDSINIYIKDIDTKYYNIAFHKVLEGSGINWGIIPINSGDYSSDNWFQSSMGVKNIIFSYIRYIYEILN